MSTVTVGAEELVVALTRGEKIAGLRGDVRVPLSAVAGVEVVPDALAAVHGLRLPGLSLPGVRKIGTWRTRDGAEYVVAARGQAGVRIRLRGHKPASVLVGTHDAEQLAARVRAALG
jgi:uncharacterized protein